MGPFLAYNIKLAICFLFFYLLYKLVFSQTTFYRINRKVVLGAYFLLLFIPFIEIETRSSLTIYPALDIVEQFLTVPIEIPSEDMTVTESFPGQDSNLWTEWLVVSYLVGVSFFILRYLYFLFRISLLLVRGERHKLDNGTVLVITKQSLSPFSWMRFIVISESDYEENNRELLLHEQAHINSKHSVDLLISQLFVIMQWFNPAVWLMKKELKEIHEYEADDAVINSGVHIKQYQLLLIKKAVGTERFNSMTNSFNHSKLKKRITMMMKKKTSAWGKLQYLAIIPTVAVSVTIFARPALAGKLDAISEAKVSELTSIKEDTNVNLVKGDTFFIKFDADTVAVMMEERLEHIREMGLKERASKKIASVAKYYTPSETSQKDTLQEKVIIFTPTRKDTLQRETIVFTPPKIRRDTLQEKVIIFTPTRKDTLQEKVIIFIPPKIRKDTP